jgi:GNAT superfamily N-acetyltransferase
MEVRELTGESARREAVALLRQLRTDRDPAAVLAWTGDGESHCFGGFEDDESVAVAGVLVAGHLYHRRVAWLSDLVVDEPRRGERLGAEMVAFVEDWARERDCERVAMGSPRDAEAAHGCFEAEGYERWGSVIERSRCGTTNGRLSSSRESWYRDSRKGYPPAGCSFSRNGNRYG